MPEVEAMDAKGPEERTYSADDVQFLNNEWFVAGYEKAKAEAATALSTLSRELAEARAERDWHSKERAEAISEWTMAEETVQRLTARALAAEAALAEARAERDAAV